VEAAATNLPHPLPATLLRESSARMPLGSLLLRDGAITAEQLEQALAEKEQSARRLGEIIVGHGWVSAATLARLLAEQHGLDYLELADGTVDGSTAVLLPESLARRYQALPVKFVDSETVLVAVADPTDVVASDDHSRTDLRSRRGSSRSPSRPTRSSRTCASAPRRRHRRSSSSTS
jgi:hypothetical protein